MTFVELLQWQNLVFILPGIGSIFYILIISITGFGDGGHDIGGGGHDISVEHDICDGGHDIGTDHDMDHDSDMDHDADQSMFIKALSFVGIGRVPISIIILTFCILWFFFGFISNLWLNHLLPPFLYFWVSLGIAFVGSILFTKMIASLLGKVMPSTETYDTTKSDLVGKTGMTNYKVTEESGFVHVTSNFSSSLEVSCRVEQGKEPIPAGTKVVLSRYLPGQDVFIVCPDPLEELIKKND